MKDYNPADTETLTNTVDTAQGDRITVSYDSVHSSDRQTFEGEVVDVADGLLTVDVGEDLRFVDVESGEVRVVTGAAVVRRIGSGAAVEDAAAAVEGGEAVLVTDGGRDVPETVEVEDPQTGETVSVPTTFTRSDLAAWFGGVPEEFEVRRVFIYDEVIRCEAVVDGDVFEVGYWPEGGPAGSFFQTDSGFVADRLADVLVAELGEEVGRTVWRRDAVDRGEGVETDGGRETCDLTVLDADDAPDMALACAARRALESLALSSAEGAQVVRDEFGAPVIRLVGVSEASDRRLREAANGAYVALTEAGVSPYGVAPNLRDRPRASSEDSVDRGEGVETDGGEVVDEVPVAEGDVEAVDEALLDAVLSTPGVLRVVVRDCEDYPPLLAVLSETSTLFGDARLSQPVGERVRPSVFAHSRGADARLDVEGVRTHPRGALVEFRVREEVVADGGSRPDLGRLSETVEAVRAQLTADRHATDGHLGTLGYVVSALGGERRD